MDEITKENIAIALAAGVTTAIVTFITFHYVRPTIKANIRK